MAGLAHARHHHAAIDRQDEFTGAPEPVADPRLEGGDGGPLSMRMVRCADSTKPTGRPVMRNQVVRNSW
jgi:hypothetical protein